MSATSFLRHRRATAVAYISSTYLTHPKAVKAAMKEHGLHPRDLKTLSGNSSVLAIADALAAENLGEPELDSLESLNVLDIGERAAVHSRDVRPDQFEVHLQHPSQETVGVGNMHDGPQAAEDLANVRAARVDANEGSLAAAAADKLAEHDPLAEHGGLPVVPNPGSAQQEVDQSKADDTAEENGEAPEGSGEAAGDGAPAGETVVDLEASAAELKKQEAAAAKLEKKGEAALKSMTREELLDYAETARITLVDIRPRTAVTTIVRQILEAQGAE